MSNILYLLIGTYTLGVSEGVYLYKFDTLTGNSEYVNMVKVENPSYLEVTKDGKYIYAVTENSEGPSFANAISFNAEKQTLSLLNSEETNGVAPCNIAIDPEGRYVVTANYGGGSLSVFKIENDKSLSSIKQLIQYEGQGADKERQESPHLHCVIFSPDNKYLFATDLGTDQIYRFDTYNTSAEILNRKTMKSYKVADGSGPRHLVFHPTGNYAYLINELSGNVMGFDYNDGDLSLFQTIDADTLQAQGSADIGITPNGKYLYASNRLKGDGIAIFSIDPANGRLTKVGYQETGIHPRNFVISPNGKYLLCASRDSNIIEIFEINDKTGLLQNIQKDIKVDMPVCLKFIN